MALPTENIDTALVRNAILHGSDDVYTLCTSEKINRWSRYKPIRDPETGINWPAGSDLRFGLNLPIDWSYLQPRGTSENEPGRLDDFRGYEHDTELAFPPVFALESEQLVQDLNPASSPVSNHWKVHIYQEGNEARIGMADLGLLSWYVGLKIFGDSVPTSYKTFFQVQDGPPEGTLISVEANHNLDTGQYINLPYGTGAYNYQIIISQSAVPNWTAVAPIAYMPLPNEGKYSSEGTFGVGKYLYADISSLSWNAWEYGSGVVKRVVFGASGTFQLTGIPGNDLSGWTIYNRDGLQVFSGDYAESGDWIDIYPNTQNLSTSDKTESISLQLTEDSGVNITITIKQLAQSASLQAPSFCNAVSGTPPSAGCGTVTGATGYIIDRKPAWMGSYWDYNFNQQIYSGPANSNIQDSLIVQGDNPESEIFYYRAAAYNNAGSSPFTNWSEGVTYLGT